MFDLRYYQHAALQAARAEHDRHQATIIVAATGTGKTEIYLAMAVAEPGRVLILAHRDYLLNSPIKRLAAHGFDDVAVEKAESRSEVYFDKAKIVFASVQSLSRPKRLATFDPRSFSLVIIDEAHRAVAATYRRVIEHFRKNPRVRFLLLTATPNRKDNIGLRNLCDGDISVAYTYSPKQAAEEGWIVPLRFYRREVEDLDFSHVNLKGTDLDPEQVEALLMNEKPLHRVCASLAEDRGPTVIFCPGVKVAHAYSLMMNTRYRPDRAVVLWQESTDEERERAGKQLANGDIDYLFNCDIVTEGYDVPELIRVVWAAPTASLVKFTQGTGRVFRPHGSLRSALDGDQDNAEQRRLLIAQSPKPIGHVVTYYPQNCRHQLCEPNDILGGADLPQEIRQAAKQIQEATAAQVNGSDPAEDVDSAHAFVGLKALIDQRRKHLKAIADVNDVEYDAFGGSRNRHTGTNVSDVKKAAKAVSEDWPPGKDPSPAMLAWLRHHGIPNASKLGLTAWRAFLLRKLIEMGIKPETALSYGKNQALAVEKKLKEKNDAG